MAKYRLEKDALGAKKVPAKAYYGIFTARAFENFNLTGRKCHPELIKALGLVKLACARSNILLKALALKRGRNIIRACTEVIAGKFNGHFVLDMLQAGAGTPHNMNANEVIANRAIELAGGKKGDYKIIDPNDHVNLGQSSNDVIPTAIRLASLNLLAKLFPELKLLEASFGKKVKQFHKIIKVGRTHLQDAVPIRLGQEFDAYREAVRRGTMRIEEAAKELLELGLGGTAIGTGINAHPKFQHHAAKELSRITGYKFKASRSKIYLTQSMSAFASLAEALSITVTEFIKVSNDLMLLSSGPLAGLNEISLPSVEPGSSIMPGKINPSIVEAFKMSCMQIQGYSEVVARASQEGNLELNVQTPLIAYNLFGSIELLQKACQMMRLFCVDGIRANRKVIDKQLNSSLCAATALTPHLGYKTTAELVKEALKRGLPLKEVVQIYLGHKSETGHISHLGLRAAHMRRP